MTAFITAFLMVFLVELGDKTQLLVMTFAAKYKWQTVIWAVFAATALNHLIAIIIGIYLNTVINMNYIHIAAACVFLLFGIMTILQKKKMTGSKVRELFSILFGQLPLLSSLPKQATRHNSLQ